MKTKILFSLLAFTLGALPLLAELKYFPKDKEELIALVADESIKLDEIDTSKITDMSFLFCEAKDETRARNYLSQCGLAVRKDYKGIGKWDVSNVETMEKMFFDNEKFNEPIGEWDVSNVKDFNYMFSGARFFNQDLSSWDMSNVKDMSWMFARTASFNQPLNSWNVSNVKNMRAMFASAKAFNQPLNSWNVSNVENMRAMFFEAVSFNQDLSSWDVRNVKDMSKMFNGASAFSYDFDWDLEGKKIKGGLIGGTALYKRLYGDK